MDQTPVAKRLEVRLAVATNMLSSAHPPIRHNICTNQFKTLLWVKASLLWLLELSYIAHEALTGPLYFLSDTVTALLSAFFWTGCEPMIVQVQVLMACAS